MFDLGAMERPLEQHTVLQHAERARDKKAVQLSECVEAFLQVCFGWVCVCVCVCACVRVHVSVRECVPLF